MLVFQLLLGKFEDALAVLEKYSKDEDAYTHELKGDALSGVGKDDLALNNIRVPLKNIQIMD